VIAGSRTYGPPRPARRPGLEAIRLDVLAAHWRAALDLAADALVVASGCRKSLGFAQHELDERRGRLAREREATTRLLALVAHEEHVQLHGLSAEKGEMR
jgi:hypothetical protein